MVDPTGLEDEAYWNAGLSSDERNTYTEMVRCQTEPYKLYSEDSVILTINEALFPMTYQPGQMGDAVIRTCRDGEQEKETDVE